MLDPALRSAVDQGHSILLYDFKYPSQSARIAGYARRSGYSVRCFAPGYPESDCCNPLDFLEAPEDGTSARQLAVTLNRNFKKEGQSAEDPFFSNAGDQLAQAVLQLAKSFKYPDLITCQQILRLDSLPERVELAGKRGAIDPWVLSSFGQLTSVGKSEKTVASIIGTASQLFTRFMTPEVMPAFARTTIPLDFGPKQMLILGMDRYRREGIAPLVAAILHMLVNRNVAQKRKSPLVLGLDELPTLYLPALVQWLNENREDGLVTLFGFQNLVQLEDTYGRELSRAIFGGAASKALFNPQDDESAERFSKFLGETEVALRQKSVTSGGGKGGRSVSRSEQRQKRPLLSANEFLQLDKGQCVFINPGHRSGRGTKASAYVPLHKRVKIPNQEVKAVERSEKLWPKIKEKRTRHSPQRKVTALDQALRR